MWTVGVLLTFTGLHIAALQVQRGLGQGISDDRVPGRLHRCEAWEQSTGPWSPGDLRYFSLHVSCHWDELLVFWAFPHRVGTWRELNPLSSAGEAA